MSLQHCEMVLCIKAYSNFFLLPPCMHYYMQCVKDVAPPRYAMYRD